MPTFTSIVTGTELLDGTPQGQHTLTVSRRVKADVATDLANPADARAMQQHLGEPHQAFNVFGSLTYLAPLRLRQTRVVPVPGTKGLYFDAVQVYDTAYRWHLLNDRYVLPVEVSWVATERQVQVYRNRTFGTNPAANLNVTSDIGGTKVDTGGKPFDGVVSQTRLKINLLVDTSQSQLTVTYDNVDSIRGKWNSSAFLHWPSQSVYCSSADVSHVRDEFYRTSYEFVWDEWFMCEQVPERDSDGYPILNVDAQVKDVYWKSLQRQTFNVDGVIFGQQPSATIAREIAKEGSFLTT